MHQNIHLPYFHELSLTFLRDLEIAELKEDIPMFKLIKKK